MLDIDFTSIDEGLRKFQKLLEVEDPTFRHAEAILKLRNDLLDAGASEPSISWALDIWRKKVNRYSWDKLGWNVF